MVIIRWVAAAAAEEEEAEEEDGVVVVVVVAAGMDITTTGMATIDVLACHPRRRRAITATSAITEVLVGWEGQPRALVEVDRRPGLLASPRRRMCSRTDVTRRTLGWTRWMGVRVTAEARCLP